MLSPRGPLGSSDTRCWTVPTNFCRALSSASSAQMQAVTLRFGGRYSSFRFSVPFYGISE